LNFLIELFGASTFRDNLLMTFETETRESVVHLKADNSHLCLNGIDALLHAIKSSANTIGALRLAKLVSVLEDTPHRYQRPGTYEGIAKELNIFMIACRKLLNREREEVH
jgi:HPt (histidine-containing phosphotransfer) domain-containing protein